MEIRIPIEIGKFSEIQSLFIVSAGIAFVLPYVIALVNSRSMSDKVRIAISVFMAFFAAVLQVVLMGKFNFADLATAFAVIFPLSIVFYRGIAMKLGVRNFENWTSSIMGEKMIEVQFDKPLSTGSVLESTKEVIANAPKVIRDMGEEGQELMAEIGDAVASQTETVPGTAVSDMKDRIKEEVKREITEEVMALLRPGR